jgi:pyruvate,water dikinase
MFGSMLGLIRGRVYYNLFNWYRLIALLPGYAANRGFLEQMLGLREALPDDRVGASESAPHSGRLRDWLRLVVMAGTLGVRIMTLPRRMERFYERLQDALGTGHPDLSLLRPDELAGYYRALERQLLTRWDAPVVNDFATMIFHGLLRRLSSRWIGDDNGTLPNDLLCAERGMISEEPARRVREIARLAAADGELVRLLCEGSVPAIRATLRERPEVDRAIEDYLDRFGDRCMEELKLESATLYDDPMPLLRSIGQQARGPGPAHARTHEDATANLRRSATARVRAALAGHPLRRLAFSWVLANARTRLRARENLRFERTRVFGRARRIFVELGRRFAAIDCLADPRDVFYLEVDEVLGFVGGSATTADLKGLVAVRKVEFDGYRSTPAPAARFETRGLIHRGHRFGAGEAVEPIAGATMQGLGCCPGIVRGPVRLVRDPNSALVDPGDIIAAERTDPGWVMIFPSASGLLVERGSLLSHSAIVARELGLPTIVSLPGVTRWLADGEWVQMDGSTGMVTKLAHPDPRPDHGDR